MAIKFQDTPVGKAFNAKLKLHSDLRHLNLEAGKVCKGMTLVKLAEAIALMEAEIEELSDNLGGASIEKLQYVGITPSSNPPSTSIEEIDAAIAANLQRA